MPALLTDTVEYANQVLRSKKVEDLNSRRTNPAGRPVEDQVALARQKAIENQVQSDPSRFLPNQKSLLRQPGVEEVIPNSTTASQLGDESVMILSARGTFYLVKLATQYGPGIYAIDELTRTVVAPDFTGPVQDRPGETNSPILLTSIEFNQVDITSQVPCLNNVKVFYSFGQNFGQVVITGEVLMGPLGNISYDGVNRLVDFFWKHRVSVYKQPIAISVANNAYYTYLTGLRIGQVNADFHILPFVMFGTLLDIEREKANMVNTSGTVITEGSLDEPSLFKALTAPVSDSTRDTAFPQRGEDDKKISKAKDPALNETPGGGTGNAGATGNDKASYIQSLLSSGPKTQLDKDIELLRRKRSDPSLTDAERLAYSNAIRGAQIQKAQEANLAKGEKVQNLRPPDQEALEAYKNAEGKLLPNKPSPPSYVGKTSVLKEETAGSVLGSMINQSAANMREFESDSLTTP